VTVYVYRLRGSVPLGQRGYRSYEPPWYALTADTQEELHPFAENVGLYRHFYRPHTAGTKLLPLVGHYDVDQGERDRAVALGAKPITARRHDKMLRLRARDLGVTWP
jgi:hypothetical protein